MRATASGVGWRIGGGLGGGGGVDVGGGGVMVNGLVRAVASVSVVGALASGASGEVGAGCMTITSAGAVVQPVNQTDEEILMVADSTAVGEGSGVDDLVTVGNGVLVGERVLVGKGVTVATGVTEKETSWLFSDTAGVDGIEISVGNPETRASIFDLSLSIDANCGK